LSHGGRVRLQVPSSKFQVPGSAVVLVLVLVLETEIEIEDENEDEQTTRHGADKQACLLIFINVVA
jgi:hypothetical protein